MTVLGTLIKFEKFLATLDLEELYLIRGIMLYENVLVNKIDKMILYRENIQYTMNQKFNKIIDPLRDDL